MLDKLDLAQYRPRCDLAHELVNKLSIIVGYCDLLRETAEAHSLCEKRLLAIRTTAIQLAAKLNQHQYNPEVLACEETKKSREVIAVTG